MNIEKVIDEFLLILSDPRNIAPVEFAEYYPAPGEKGNPKNLDKIAIEKHFSNLQKFKISKKNKGFISLKAKLYLLLETYNKESKENKEIALNYFVLSAKNQSLIIQSFVLDKILTKTEFYSLLNIYTVFHQTLLQNILIDLETILSEHKEKTTINKDKTLPDYTFVTSFFADGSIFKKGTKFYFKNKEFKSQTDLIKHIKETFQNNKIEPQYIKDNLAETTKPIKNIFRETKEMRILKNTIEYCKQNNIEITESFLKKSNNILTKHE